MRRTLLVILIAAALPAQAADLKALQCGNVFDSKTAKLIGPQTITIDKNTIKSMSPGKQGSAHGGLLDESPILAEGLQA